MSGSVTVLVAQLRSGDPAVRDEAARQIWNKYFPQLLEIARRQISDRLRTREDEEDVLQTMYKSFCQRQERGDFTLEGRDDLWKLLVTMTLNKARKAAERHGRQARDYRREQAPPSDDDGAQQAFEHMDQAQPTPDEALLLNEALERRLRGLDAQRRTVALLKLEGYSNGEIASKCDVTERTIERWLERIREQWLPDDAEDAAEQDA